MTKLTIYTDGGARGNPGPSGIGVAIYGSGEHPYKQIYEFIGEGTNNQAEYKALIRVLKEAKDLGGTEVVCFLDSELVVNQLNGKYKVKEAGLQKLIVEVMRISNSFLSVRY